MRTHPTHKAKGKGTGDLSEEIVAVLRRHQTIQERNICLMGGSSSHPLWIRTCYDPELESKYEDIERGSWVGDPSGIELYFALNDSSLYDCQGTSIWKTLHARVPSFFDRLHEWEYPEDPNYGDSDAGDDSDYDELPDTEELRRDPCSAKIIVYVVNHYALRKGIVKMFWFDVHGVWVWKNEIEPGAIQSVQGALCDAQFLLDTQSSKDKGFHEPPSSIFLPSETGQCSANRGVPFRLQRAGLSPNISISSEIPYITHHIGSRPGLHLSPYLKQPSNVLLSSQPTSHSFSSTPSPTKPPAHHDPQRQA
ncbi:hypothetical protein P154DRAFT_533420 [Amniculicola lignicola CBS 123094]|uniref:Uncharacterized protein n=1 Tax=Amniculicola lignicola CBS 123094 TaxID=1392246 RepID=A0A6A5WK24_9PLEO|nr:hypothetical protein P154DRAFT_533420 [Amniculicola lignicola CBS 123094]